MRIVLDDFQDHFTPGDIDGLLMLLADVDPTTSVGQVSWKARLEHDGFRVIDDDAMRFTVAQHFVTREQVQDAVLAALDKVHR